MRIRLPRALALFALILPLAISPLCAQQATSLQQHMSAAEFKAAGLNKLSTQELAYLDHWLDAQGKPKVKVVDSSGKSVFYAGEAKRSRIYTRIVGPFDGWSAGREFNMDNGQVWRISDQDPHQCKPGNDVEVQIKPSLLGNWLMYVPSCYENVHVKRVR